MLCGSFSGPIAKVLECDSGDSTHGARRGMPPHSLKKQAMHCLKWLQVT